HDPARKPQPVETRQASEDVPEIELCPKPEAPVARQLKIDAPSSLKREVVLVAHTAVIEAEQQLRERQEPGVLDWNAHSCTPEKGRDGRAVETIEADFAEECNHRHVRLDRAGQVEMSARVAVVTRLVVSDIEIGAERSGIGSCRLGGRGVRDEQQGPGK